MGSRAIHPLNEWVAAKSQPTCIYGTAKCQKRMIKCQKLYTREASIKEFTRKSGKLSPERTTLRVMIKIVEINFCLLLWPGLCYGVTL